MAGPRIGGGGGTPNPGYMKPDNRPHVSTVDAVWPGAYRIALRYSRVAGNDKTRARLLGDLKMRIIESCATRPEIPVPVGYVAMTASDLIALADADGLRT